jgi:tape measure domain-containing protein
MAIREELTLGLGGWQANLDKARNDVRRFGAEIRQMGVEARSTRGSAAGGAGGGGMLGGMIGPVQGLLPAVTALGAFRVGIDAVATSMERQRAEMALGAVSTEGVSDQLERLAELAEAPGLGFDQVVSGSTRLQAVGLSAKQAEETILEMGNALALVGGGKDQLDGVLLALTQIVAKGTVSAEEINQIAERLPQIRRLMEDAFGTADTEALQKMGIGAEEFIAAVTDAAGNLERATATSSEAMSNLQDDWKAFMQSVGDIAEPLLGPAFKTLSGFLEKAAVGVKELAAESEKIVSNASIQFQKLFMTAEERQMVDQIQNEDRKKLSDAISAGEIPWLSGEWTSERIAAHFKENEERIVKEIKAKEVEKEKQDEEIAKFENAEAEATRDANRRRDAAAAKKQADREQAEEKAKAERDRLTESVSRLSFEFASPEEQMRIMRERIQSSLGVSGSREEILAAAATATAEGRLTDAETGLQSLKELEAIAGRVPAGDMSTGAAGSFAGLMDQIFGRGTPEQQLDEMRKANTLAEDTSRTLDMILVRMEEAPAVSVFGED